MALTTVSDVVSESGFSYSVFGFTSEDDFDTWVQRKINWISQKIKTAVGSSVYDQFPVNEDIHMGEIFWVMSTMLSRRHLSLASSIEGGFAIGSLRIDAAGKATNDVADIANNCFKKAQTLLRPYITVDLAVCAIAEDLEADDEFDRPPDRFYLRLV